ncbi:MAG: S41 family peptidase [Burkholderiales bacterium]|nr:MAG: S41 family peptidase [Burkholderiales bacterium]TAG80037.1 MAG: S41 family peptidase [Betaproteobacteria bacterium]
MKLKTGHTQKFTWIGAGAVLGVALSLALTVDANREARSTIPVDELRAFSEVYARIKNDYVIPVDDKKLIDQAISGMVSGLDPHSTYLDELAMREMRTTTTGKFGGIGIEIGTEDGYIRVVTPIDDTPASRAGIRAGDLITKVDGETTRGLTTTKAVERMRGMPGTKVRIEIYRKEEKATITHTLERQEIKVQAVRAREIEPGFSYVRVRTFNELTVGEVVKALSEQHAKTPLKGVVLDLRNNPGGLLDAAIGLSAVFLPKDALVVYTEGRVEGARVRYTASREHFARRGPDVVSSAPAILKSVPLVVLTNAGSASASEIVAGALQDHKRATVMGMTTFGKGSVQNIIPLSSTTGMKLTTSKYFTPNGRSIQGTGIDADITIDQLTWDGVVAPKVQREKDLARHLVGRDEKKDDAADPDDDLTEEGQEAKLLKAREDAKKLKGFDWGNEKDFLYAQAVNKIKGLPVVKSTVDTTKTAAKPDVVAGQTTTASKRVQQ